GVLPGYRASGVGDGRLGSSDSLHPIAVTRINPSAQLADGGGAVGLVEDAGADDEPVDAGAAGGGDGFGVEAAVHLEALVGAEALSDRLGFRQRFGHERLAAEAG